MQLHPVLLISGPPNRNICGVVAGGIFSFNEGKIMKSKIVTRYICDHCDKYMYSKNGMARHELRCTLNPDRHCAVCSLVDLCAKPLAEIIATIPSHDLMDFGFDWPNYYENILLPKMPEIRGAADNCPACLMAAFRQSAIPLPMLPCFNFTEEMKVIFKRKNEEREEECALLMDGYNFYELRG